MSNDIVGAVITYLAAEVDANVAAAWPTDGALPAIRVRRIGGVLRQPSNAAAMVGADTADLSVQVQADTEYEADRLADQARAAMHAIPGATLPFGVNAVREVGAPQALTDESRPKPTPLVAMTFAVTYL